jgi:hypothetical protein
MDRNLATSIIDHAIKINMVLGDLDVVVSGIEDESAKKKLR